MICRREKRRLIAEAREREDIESRSFWTSERKIKKLDLNRRIDRMADIFLTA